MTEWKTYKLGDIAKFQTGKLNSNAAVENGKYPFFTCSPTTLSIDTYAFDKEAILLAGNNAEGNFSIKYYKGKFNAYQRTYIIETYNDICDIKFLFYALKLCLQQFKLMSQGTSTKFLTAVILNNFEISLPSLEEQRRIAGILGAIDDKIENNRRINTNLELQAQALFDKIFFDDNDAERNPLSDYADINPTRALHQGVVARYIEMANLPTKGSFPSDWSYKSYGGGCKFANGDTIMARITPCLENGKTAYIDFLEEQEVAFGSTEYIVISAKNGYCPALFYFLARNREFVDYAVGHMNGSSGRQRVGGVDIANFPMPHITLEESNKFAEIAMPIMDVIRNNSLENRHLATLRDTLLPKLMNGEIKL